MGYYIDLERITIDEYQTKLESAYLPPGRMILKEELDERFGYFKSIGIKNVQELIQILKKKEKLAELSKVQCLSENYLKILLRELNSTLPKPNKIAEFTNISKEIIEKLEECGIKNTKHLFDRIKTKTDIQNLAGSINTDYNTILELSKLTDLSRIKWVGVTFARMLYELGIDTVKKASECDPVYLHARINQLNKEKSIYKANIGLNDIKIFVDAAKEVPLDIEFE